MGTLILQLGQCGNQIGLQMWDYLQNMHYYENDYLFRREQNVAHSIMVDTEAKVLKPISENRKKYSFIDNRNIIFQQNGRGNNWSLGYFDSRHLEENKGLFPKRKEKVLSEKVKKTAPKTLIDDKYMKENQSILETISDSIRREIEKIDYYLGSMFIYSLGGGTGSGLGSRILEEMTDEYDGGFLYNTVVFPSKSGETPLQHYNCVFGVAALQSFSDGIIYFQNEKLNSFLTLAGGLSNQTLVNITNLNEYIGSIMSNLLKLNDTKNLDKFYFDILSELTPLKDMKFLELFSTPFIFNKKASSGPESSWENVIDNCLSQVNFEDDEDMEDKTLKEAKKIAKGIGKQSFLPSTISLTSVFKSSDIDRTLIKNEMMLRYLDRKLNQLFNPVKWNPEAFNFEFLKEKHEKIIDSKQMVLLANRTGIADNLRDLNKIAYSKYKAKAYLHWYYKNGLEEYDFEEAFGIIDGIVENYSNIMF